jgi:hypothetical protein
MWDGFQCCFADSIGGDGNYSNLPRLFNPINSDENEFRC